MLQVHLGDCVSITAGDFLDQEGNSVEHLLRITEIFYTIEGQRLFRVNWFYKDLDTAMAVVAGKAKKGDGLERWVLLLHDLSLCKAAMR